MKKLHMLDLYVIFSIIVLLVYTVVSQVLASTYGIQMDTLTTCFFACFGGEILSACLIKIFKLKVPRSEERTDEEDNVG